MSCFDLRTLPLAVAAAVALAISSPVAAQKKSTVAVASAARGGDAAPSEQKSKSRAAPKRKPARLEVVDGTAFTITEQARISGDARAEYEGALQMLEQERYDQGIALLLEVVEKAPDVTAPYIDLGIAYKRIGDLERAKANLETAIELNPSHPVAYDELGLVYREMGRFADARASYEKALAVYAGFHFAHRNLAILCDIYLDDLPCALSHYEAYAAAEPGDKDVGIWIADIRKRLGR